MRGLIRAAMAVALASASIVFVFARAERAAAAEPAVIPGKVERVTLYRAEALVIRTLPVEGEAGQIEVRVPGLPPHVVPESLFAEAVPGVEVRAVRFRAQAVEREPDDAVHDLDREIIVIEEAVARNARLTALLGERLRFLERLETFVAPTATTELTKGVLNADTLERLARFSFTQRETVANESLKLANEARDLAQRLALAKAKRAELATGPARTVREALLFLEKRVPGAVVVRLGYVVREAGWSPAYNFHAEGKGPVRIEYNAIIHQMTGEDWSDVALVLSTATPGLSAEGPGLAPFRVALSGRPGQASQADYGQQLAASRGRLEAAGRGQRGAQSVGENREQSWDLNEAAGACFSIEITADPDALRVLGREQSLAAVEPSVEYRLATRVSLASRADQQLVRVDEVTLQGKPYYVATPALTSYVYREAELIHTGKEALLAGPVNVYLDGRFMGRGEIPTVASGETFVMGFGADAQLRARRELVKKSESVRGGNREVSFQYRLVLENFKDAAVTVRLYDRLPLPESPDEVRVTLEPPADPLSKDELYLRVERAKGILRWDIEVPAQAAGEKARLVAYAFTLEFDKTRALATPDATPGRQEFEEMQKARYSK